MRHRLPFLLLVVGMALGIAGCTTETPASHQTLDVISVKGPIDPQVSTYLRDRLTAADRDGIQAAVIQLDTPGGLEVSIREIADAILESDTPVVVWIAPRGAIAASAGTFVAYAATLVYMADGSTIGPPTPVNLSDGPSSSPDDAAAAAYLKDLGLQRNRGADWAEAAVSERSSIGASEAVSLGIADGVASSLGDLLRTMDGQSVGTPQGRVTLETWDEDSSTPSVAIRFQEMDLLQRLLHSVTDPNVAYLLLLIGLFGIIFEIYNPGIGLAAIIGAAALLLGFFALSVLPTNWLGALLVVVGVALLVVDLHIGGLGPWSVGGLAGLIVGGLVLFSGSSVHVGTWTIVVGVAGSLLFFISVMTAALRVRLRRPITGEESLVGAIGEAKTDIAPEGTVVTKGTLWRARTMETGIAAGSKVEVKATEGLVLLVEPLHDREIVE